MHKIFFKKANFTLYFKDAMAEFFMRSAWVILFIVGCGIIYERSIISLDSDYQQLMTQYLLLQNEHEEALALKTELSAKVNSHSDPAWVELTLMRVLGLAPEGQVKVLFKDEGATEL